MPGVPAADLVLVKPHLVLRLLEVFLDRRGCALLLTVLLDSSLLIRDPLRFN
jgi:hypothetical protein